MRFVNDENVAGRRVRHARQCVQTGDLHGMPALPAHAAHQDAVGDTGAGEALGHVGHERDAVHPENNRDRVAAFAGVTERGFDNMADEDAFTITARGHQQRITTVSDVRR